MAFGPINKYPDEQMDIPLDWSAKLDQFNTAISDSQWLATPTGLTIVAQTVVGANAVVRISGGEAGATYTLENTVTFEDGQERQAFITVNILTDAVP